MSSILLFLNVVLYNVLMCFCRGLVAWGVYELAYLADPTYAVFVGGCAVISLYVGDVFTDLK